MITYNWRAEFVKGELEHIDRLRKTEGGDYNRHIDRSPTSEESNLLTYWLPASSKLIAEMANALDRYEAILNEQEQPRFQAYRDKDGAIKVINNAKTGRDEDDNS